MRAAPHLAVLRCSLVQQLLVALEDGGGALVREEAAGRAVKLAELSGLIASAIAHLVPSAQLFSLLSRSRGCNACCSVCTLPAAANGPWGKVLAHSCWRTANSY